MNRNASNVAVIDIGSNSVRLVIYDCLERVQMPVFNEKVLCGLAEGMQENGKLSPKGVVRAKKAVARFSHLCNIMQVNPVFFFATSAVRDADDGAEFVEYLQNEHQIEIDILSGADEAKYAAYGAISTINNPKGIVGDLGGGSLELTTIDNKQFNNSLSLPLGPLRVVEEGKIDRSELKKHIDSHLEESFLQHVPHNQNFYPIGGAFRTLAKIHMEKKKYPLKVIHNYKTSASSFENSLQVISRMSPNDFKKIDYVLFKRTKYLSYAALLASRIIKFSNVKNVIFCAYGVREGILYEKLQENLRDNDPLIEGCKKIAKRTVHSQDYGEVLFKWIMPLFKMLTAEQERLILASCILSDISCYENASYRGELAYKRVLDSSLTGISHKQRLFIAISLYQRYNYSLKDLNLKNMKSFIGKKSLERAKILGSAIRLARSLSSSEENVLLKSTVSVSSSTLTLRLNKNYLGLAGEATEKRLKKLANLLDLENWVIKT